MSKTTAKETGRWHNPKGELQERVQALHISLPHGYRVALHYKCTHPSAGKKASRKRKNTDAWMCILKIIGRVKMVSKPRASKQDAEKAAATLALNNWVSIKNHLLTIQNGGGMDAILTYREDNYGRRDHSDDPDDGDDGDDDGGLDSGSHTPPLPPHAKAACTNTPEMAMAYENLVIAKNGLLVATTQMIQAYDQACAVLCKTMRMETQSSQTTTPLKHPSLFHVPESVESTANVTEGWDLY